MIAASGLDSDGFHTDDVAWLLDHAAGNVVPLRPGARRRPMSGPRVDAVIDADDLEHPVDPSAINNQVSSEARAPTADARNRSILTRRRPSWRPRFLARRDGRRGMRPHAPGSR